MQGCYSCDRSVLGDELPPWEQLYLDDQWRLTLAFDTSLPGWLVLVPLRHLEGLHQLDTDEAENLGRLLRAASMALVHVTGCLKTYVMLFAEAEGFGHLHFHIVPRHAELPKERRGPAVFSYLGAPPERQLPDLDRDDLAAKLRDAIH